MLAEDFGVPVPGETILIGAAVHAGAGRLNLVLVALIGLVAAVLGDNIAYGLGRAGGHRLLLRFGRFVLLTEKRLDTAESITKMRWTAFLLFNSIGAALWVGSWVAVGYVSGNHLQTVYSKISQYLLYVVLAVAAVVVLLVARHIVRRRRASAAEDTGVDQVTHRPRPDASPRADAPPRWGP